MVDHLRDRYRASERHYGALTKDLLDSLRGKEGFSIHFFNRVILGAGGGSLPLSFPDFLKEWAFTGFFIVLASAFIAHLGSGDGLKKSMSPIFVAVVLALSYVTFSLGSWR